MKMMRVNDIPVIRKDRKSWSEALGVPNGTMVELLTGRWLDRQGEMVDEVYLIPALDAAIAFYEDMAKVMSYAKITKLTLAN